MKSRKRRGANGGSIGGRENVRGGLGLNTFRPKKKGDVEAADFDENELDDLSTDSDREREAKALNGSGGGHHKEKAHDVGGTERYSIGAESDSD